MAQAKATRKKRPKKRAVEGGSRIPPKRLQLVEQMMSAFCSRREVAVAIAAEFGLTEKTGLNYYDRVEAEWKDTLRPKKAYARTKLIHSLEQIVKGASSAGKWHAAVAAVDKLCKIHGVYEAEVIEVNIPDLHPVETMTSAEMRAYVADEMDRADKCQADLDAAKSVH